MSTMPGPPRAARAARRWLAALLFAALAATALAATAAELGPHQDAADQNTCRKCHDTAAGTPALRGWFGATSGPSTGWGAKALSALCYKCHSSGGGNLVNPGHNMLANAYDDNSHGFVIADVPREPEGSVQGSGVRQSVAESGLPYTAAAITQLECTSCHNVHRSADRPFSQRATLQELCEACHEGRAANSTGSRIVPGQLRSYSTHPTRRALADTARANIKAAGSIDAALRVATPAAPSYSLGGHLGPVGEFDCQTCHAVHGPALGTPGKAPLLAIDNASGATNGSRLCEGCHYGGAAGEQVGVLVVQSTLGAGEYSDHPIDAAGNQAFYPTGVVLPTNWRSGGPNLDRGAEPFYTGTGLAPASAGAPACSSCHDTHGGIANTPLLRGPQPVAGFGPLNYNDWCFACHAATLVLPAGHHSVVNNLAVALGDALDSQLTCGDCHGPAGSTEWNAHNGFWTFAVAVTQTGSALCLGCHSAANPADLVSPTAWGRSFTEPAPFPSTHGTARGGASHYLGPDSGEFPGANPKVTAWASGYFSKYGAPNTGGGGAVAPAGVGEIICESCHHPVYNDGRVNYAVYGTELNAGWKSNLLLERYEDDPPGLGTGVGAYAVGSALCRGCHAAIGTHHPQTGDVVSLSGLALDTDLTGFANQTSAPVGGGPAPGTLSYRNADDLDCDSCHRPHRADDDSDVAAAQHGASTSSDGRATRHILEVDGPSHRYSDLCAECHAR